jgi:hypothetical protein
MLDLELLQDVVGAELECIVDRVDDNCAKRVVAVGDFFTGRQKVFP